MKKHKTFSITDIYKSKQTVFTTRDIALIWRENDLDLLKARLKYYVDSGKLIRLRRGLYAKSKDYKKDEVAIRIFTPAYISLETVLGREGITFQHYESIFIVSYLSREISCDSQTYVFKKIKNSVLTNPMGVKQRDNTAIATKERAFLDCLYLYGDFYIDHPDGLDWDICKQMAPIYQNLTLIKRLNKYAADRKT